MFSERVRNILNGRNELKRDLRTQIRRVIQMDPDSKRTGRFEDSNFSRHFEPDYQRGWGLGSALWS